MRIGGRLCLTVAEFPGGDGNRNARLARLREAAPLSNAIMAVDLADSEQMVVVTDHESRVLARRTSRRHAWELGAALDRAARADLIRPDDRADQPDGLDSHSARAGPRILL